VQCLENPLYLQHLASQKLFDDPAFVAYLDYLRYFQRPEYITFLLYPGPTLDALELVQNEQFRKDILSPEIVARMIEAGVRASVGEA
jgi:mediator of RNA polymerase II transcription subunit 31